MVRAETRTLNRKLATPAQRGIQLSAGLIAVPGVSGRRDHDRAGGQGPTVPARHGSSTVTDALSSCRGHHAGTGSELARAG